MSAPFDSLFSPSAFEAARVIRAFRARHPSLDAGALLDLIRTMSPDSHDYEAGLELNLIVAEDADATNALFFYRRCIECLISQNPIWLRIITLGRKKFVQKLSPDEQNCFLFAGLLLDPPDDTAVAWWDKTIIGHRTISELEAMKRARAAEQLSLSYEKQRLRKSGIDLNPIWMGFDDNTVGYDILSYDPGSPHPINRLIEVKSTIASPLRFFISRNEWEAARKFGSRYFFHVWDLRGPQLYERTVADISPKIPTDNMNGQWTNAVIPI